LQERWRSPDSMRHPMGSGRRSWSNMQGRCFPGAAARRTLLDGVPSNDAGQLADPRRGIWSASPASRCRSRSFRNDRRSLERTAGRPDDCWTADRCRSGALRGAALPLNRCVMPHGEVVHSDNPLFWLALGLCWCLALLLPTCLYQRSPSQYARSNRGACGDPTQVKVR
jgi:hypothetical protein